MHQARRSRCADAPRGRLLVFPEHLAAPARGCRSGRPGAAKRGLVGPKADPARLDAQHIAQLTRERDHLRVELDKAQLVIEVQKKVTALLDLLAAQNKRGNT